MRNCKNEKSLNSSINNLRIHQSKIDEFFTSTGSLLDDLDPIACGEMSPARYTNSKRGKPVLICEENFYYHAASKSGNKTHWTCVERKTIYRLI